MGYVLTASLFIRTEDGRPVQYRRGDVIDGLGAADVKRLLAAEAIAPKPGVTAAPPPEPAAEAVAVAEDDGGADTPTTEALERPKAAQSVAVWRQYAVAIGAVAEDAAADMSKQQLQEATR